MENTYFNLKYLHKYPNNDEFSGFCYTDRYYEPFVSTTFLAEGVKDRVDYNLRRRQKMLKEYLTFEFLEDGSFVWKSNKSTVSKTIEYKKNDGEWTEITSTVDGVTVPVQSGDIIRFRGNNTNYCDEITGEVGSTTFTISCAHFYSANRFNVYGNTMSLINSENFVLKDDFSTSKVFAGLFSGCTGLVDAEWMILPCISLTESCYERMFQGCTNLTIAPELDSMALADRCYYGMFYDCASLEKCPALPATTLADNCYLFMFRGCTSITEIPELPSINLTTGCYRYMFNRCSSLHDVEVKIPENGSISPECLRGMFAYASGITSAVIDLPLDEIPENALYSMFICGATLTNVEANFGSENSVAGDGAFRSVFEVCDALVDASNIKINTKTIGNSGCTGMFYHCSNLRIPPELPATTIGANCYRAMFSNCTNLATAPELPARELKPWCYHWMFSTTKVNRVVCLGDITTATTASHMVTVPEDCLNAWLGNIESSGEVVVNSDADENVWRNVLYQQRDATTHAPLDNWLYCVPRNWTITKLNS